MYIFIINNDKVYEYNVSISINISWMNNWYTGSTNISIAALGYNNPIITSVIAIPNSEYIGILFTPIYNKTSKNITIGMMRPDNGHAFTGVIRLSIREGESV